MQQLHQQYFKTFFYILKKNNLKEITSKNNDQIS